jgi:hypothetical protein
MRRKARAWSAGAVAIGSLVASSVGTGAESASRIIDRTLVCRPAGTGHPDPVRFVNVYAEPFQPSVGGAPSPPWASVSNPGAGDLGVHVSIRTGPYSSNPTGAVWLSRRPCRRTKIHVSFSSKGLEGGMTGPAGDRYQCDVSAKVLIRVRAQFERPTRFVRDARFPSPTDIARGPISTGYLIVTSVRGRTPIFFATLNGKTGKARAFAAQSRCRAER